MLTIWCLLCVQQKITLYNKEPKQDNLWVKIAMLKAVTLERKLSEVVQGAWHKRDNKAK